MRFFNYDIIKRNKKERSDEQDITTNVYSSGSLLFNPYSLSNQTAQSLSVVYRAVDLISDSIAVLPIEILNTKNKEIKSHYLNRLFKNCNLTKYNLIKLLIQSIILKGAGFAYINRANGIPVSLTFLRKEDVQIHYDELYRIKYFTADKISHSKIQPEDMIYLIKNTYDGVNGVSVLSYAARSLQISHQAENSAKNYFDNGGSLSGVLKVQGQISEKQREQIKSGWNQSYVTGNQGIAILPGNMEYQAIQVAAKDIQLLESRQWNVQDIARFFSIHPILLGDNSGSSYSSIEAIQNQFVLHTLIGYIQLLEEEFTRKLCPDNVHISFDENYLLRTDKQAQASYYTQLLDKGVLTVDEVRESIGYNPVGLNKHYIPYTDLNQNNLNQSDNSNSEEENKEDNTNNDGEE